MPVRKGLFCNFALLSRGFDLYRSDYVPANLVYLPTCLSTNDEAWALLDTAKAGHGTLVYAAEQTAGRGQRGTQWLATPGQNLLCSTLLHVAGRLETEALFDLSRAVALAAAKAVEILTKQQVKPVLKWPNDLYADGAKLGGILIENRFGGGGAEWSVVGLGLNVNQMVFAPEIQATSLKLLTGADWELAEAAHIVREQLIDCIQGLAHPESLRKEYQKLLKGIGQIGLFCEPQGKPFEAILLGTTAEGLLRLLTEQGERRYDLKEVMQLGSLMR